MIVLNEVSKSYDGGESFAVREVDVRVEQGEFIVLLGTSGCGKTTTLKMINRLIEATHGRIEVDGQDVSAMDPVQLRRQIGYVFQGIGLFTHMTVRENVAIVPRLLKWPRQRTDEHVDELLEMVGLPPGEYAERLPGHLSGGQKQRIGVARALAARPKIMLVDEPFGALDPLTRDTLQSEYRRLHESLGLTTIMVTHDMTEALLMADRIGAMHAGRLLQIDTPHTLLTDPVDDYVRDLMERPKKQAERVEQLVQEAQTS